MSKPYSPTIVSNGNLYISGQVGLDHSTGQLVSGGVITELKQIMNNLLNLLKENNCDYDDVVSITIYLKSMDDYAAVNQEYVTYFKKRMPTRTCIAVAGLPFNCSIEITAVAEIK